MSKCSLTSLVVILLVTVAGRADEVRGVVTKVDPDRKEIVLEGRGKGLRGRTFTLTVAPETRIQVGQKAAQLGDLTAGKRVRVSFETRGGKHVAISVSSLDLLANLLGSSAPAPSPGPAPAVNAAGDTVAGELRRVALTDRELVVVGADGRETVLAVPEELAVVRNGKPASFEDLKQGEQAVVRFVARDGKRVATSVQVGEGAATAPQENRIQRLRRVLKYVDVLLDIADRAKLLDP